MNLAPAPPAVALPRKRLDPRWLQILILSSLLAWGQAYLHFDLPWGRVLLTLGSALLAQAFFSRLFSRPRLELPSAAISALSLCLLLRTDRPALVVLGASIAIGSKFLLRWHGKHVFNPTNLALVVLLLGSDHAWVSASQWGARVSFAFFLACAGLVVTGKSSRADIPLGFLAAHTGLLLARAAWLGDPWAIPLHQLQSGSLLIFAFFMISDPKTTPNSRAGRLLFAVAVALGGYFVQFVLYRPNGLLYSLAAWCLATPLLDRWLPGRRFEWPGAPGRPSRAKEIPMKRLAPATLGLLAAVLLPASAHAFCGFYVARADTKLFNRSSQVVLARNGDRTVLSMANDFQGDLKEFAIVIPVPTFITREQIHVAEKALIDHLDAYSAPRLVEYFDPDPCREAEMLKMSRAEGAAPSDVATGALQDRARSLGVTIEAQYTVGEYDILILSAKQSDGLATWLTESGYKLPPGAAPVLGSYLKQGMKFFVAKVNLGEQSKLGYSYLRPLQVAYESPKFMLPIRLGTVNADGPQELFLYALTENGRVETTNYRTVRLPSDAEIPVFVKDDFPHFYKDLFTRVVDREGKTAVFLEYAWNMNSCDPCSADPLTDAELRELGVFWTNPMMARGPAPDVYITRLHVRYDRDHFPEDLVLQETGDRQTFQGRYILRHPWTGSARCEAADQYRRSLRDRFEKEAQTLANLTGWDINDIRNRLKIPPRPEDEPWWKKIWKNGR
ncbi:MAG: DUF2330 domain-containing protein [Thermoanaerobaculia bacterium]